MLASTVFRLLSARYQGKILKILKSVQAISSICDVIMSHARLDVAIHSHGMLEDP
jgi:hypothetical protein